MSDGRDPLRANQHEDAPDELQTLLDALGDGIVLVQWGRVSRINRAAAELLGVDADRAPGQPAIQVLRDHRLERVLHGTPELELTIRGRVVQAQRIPGGLTLRDVSATRRAEDNARELLAVLSHELRTPVTTIRSTLEALEYDLSSEERRRFLGRAVAEAERLSRLLEDLTIDVRPPRARRVELRGIVERALALLHETFERHRVAASFEVPSGAVWADEDKLLQVILNLLENAAVHGPDDAAVLLRATAAPEDPGLMHVVVRDEGDPLPADAFEALFEPHARGGSRARGSGLGLYIVRSIAQRWGGSAWGRPHADGNEFGFSVPRR